MDGTNCIKQGENQQRVVYKAKHKPCMFGIYQAGSQKLYWGFAMRFFAIFRGDFVEKFKNSLKYPKNLFLEEFGFCDLGQSKKTLT